MHYQIKVNSALLGAISSLLSEFNIPHEAHEVLSHGFIIFPSSTDPIDIFKQIVNYFGTSSVLSGVEYA